MPTIEVDARTARTLEFAARMAELSVGQLIARMVEQVSAPFTSPKGAPTAETRVEIHADYEGIRTFALFDPRTKRIDIVSGPLGGRSFKSPSFAAREVVHSIKPGVSPHRNGWGFWIVTGTGNRLQSVRQ